MDSIEKSVTSALVQIYNLIKGVFTLVAAVVFAICCVGMMVAKNQKTVDEFKSWRMRVIIAWLVFNGLGLIVSFGTELFKSDDITNNDVSNFYTSK